MAVRIGAKSGHTDEQGRFLLAGISTQDTTLVVDGTTANTKDRSYGRFDIHIEPKAGQTSELGFPVWMTPLDTQHTVHFEAPAKSEVVLKTPQIPGLEVRIPKGSVVRDEHGKPVTELGITPIALDRAPFPLPKHGVVPVFFTVQPGGTYIFPLGAQVIYPNYTHEPPGTRVEFMDYDPKAKGWYVYGHGQVSRDGRQVVPDATTRVWAFHGAMFNVSDLVPLHRKGLAGLKPPILSVPTCWLFIWRRRRLAAVSTPRPCRSRMGRTRPVVGDAGRAPDHRGHGQAGPTVSAVLPWERANYKVGGRHPQRPATVHVRVVHVRPSTATTASESPGVDAAVVRAEGPLGRPRWAGRRTGSWSPAAINGCPRQQRWPAPGSSGWSPRSAWSASDSCSASRCPAWPARARTGTSLALLMHRRLAAHRVGSRSRPASCSAAQCTRAAPQGRARGHDPPPAAQPSARA